MKDKRIKLFYTDKSAELCGRIILKVYRYENYGRKAGRADVCRHTQQRRFQGVLRGRGQQGGGDGIPDGLYYFDPTSDELVELPAGGSAPSASSGTLSPTNAKARRANIETLKGAFPPNEIMQAAGITLFFTGILDRIVWRYKEAAYRELQLDAGSYAGLVAILAHWRRNTSKYVCRYTDYNYHNRATAYYKQHHKRPHLIIQLIF